MSQMESVMDIQSKMCDPEQLHLLLKLPENSDMTYEEFSGFICNQNNTDVVQRIALDFLKKMEISNLVESVSNS